MQKTFSEKILAKYSGKSHVVPGEIVEVIPDIAMSHDNTAAISKTFAKIGVDKLYNPDIHLVVLDHCVPPANEALHKIIKISENLSKSTALKNFTTSITASATR